MISSNNALVESGTVSTWFWPKFLGNKYGNASGDSAAFLVLLGGDEGVAGGSCDDEAKRGLGGVGALEVAGAGEGENLAV